MNDRLKLYREHKPLTTSHRKCIHCHTLTLYRCRDCREVVCLECHMQHKIEEARRARRGAR